MAPGELKRRRRDDLADAALRAAREQRQDAFAHPRPADIGGDPVRVLGGCELEDQHEVCVVDSDDSRCRRAGVPDARHNVAARLLRLRGERVAQNVFEKINWRQGMSDAAAGSRVRRGRCVG